MKIRTKLLFEIIILMSLVGMISFVTLTNTKKAQDSFLDLSSTTLPTLNNLQEMKEAVNSVTLVTTEITMIEQEHEQASLKEKQILEERIETKFNKIEQAKIKFNHAFSRYTHLLEEKFPENVEQGHMIAEKWNNLLIISNTLIEAKAQGIEGDQILELREKFSKAQEDFDDTVSSVILTTSSNIENKKNVVESLASDTTIMVLVSLNLFIVTAVAVRFLVLRSISNPLSELSKAAHQIAKGNFTKVQIKGEDEISEVGKDINKMSADLEELHKTLVRNERLSSIGSLASRLAHDLRNPLSVIKNSMNILGLKLDPIMDQKTSSLIARVGRAVDRMSHQIDDVLDYVNVSKLQLRSNSLSTIIESAYLNSNVPTYVKVQLPDNNYTINCDSYKLEIVFSNIINNAVHAIDGEGEITIKINNKNEDFVSVEISDSGPGIEESEASKIFEPLYTTKQIGTGLGLASCKSIVEKHGGTISVHNNPTTFSVILPKDPLAIIKKLQSQNLSKKQDE